MIGAEDNDAGWPAWHQYYPATVHWRASRTDIGSLRLVHNGPVRARAAEGELTIECGPAPDGSKPTFLRGSGRFRPRNHRVRSLVAARSGGGGRV